MKKISDKIIERLGLYRHLLEQELLNNREYIFSHELADLAQTTSAQVRRDLMVLEHMGNPNRGYLIAHLIHEISSLLGTAHIRPVGLIGVGNLGRALLSYFVGRRPDLPISATFDSDPEKNGRVISGCRCYAMDQLEKIVIEKEIKIIILAVPAEVVQKIVNSCVKQGVKSFINFTHVPLKVPPHIFVENIDITLMIEKAAYFVE